MTDRITHKKKTSKSKKELWSQIENNFKDEKPIECLYRVEGQRENCDMCKSSVRMTENGFLACSNPKCSVIYKDMVDQSAEWRYYGAEDSNSADPTRCGMPVNPLLVESSYGCKVICQGSTTYEMRKIRRYTEWQSMPYKEKSQYDEFQRITIIAHNAGIPKISEHKTFRGLNRDGIIAASIYISCRTNDCPRTAKEIATIFTLDNTSATKGCKNATAILNEIECEMTNKDKTSLCKTKPEDFIERYCSKLNINQVLTKCCKFVALRIQKGNMIPENTPHSIAAGIVYFISQICKLNISKRDVNKVSEISEVTINKCFKKLESIQDKLVPKAILDKYA